MRHWKRDHWELHQGLTPINTKMRCYYYGNWLWLQVEVVDIFPLCNIPIGHIRTEENTSFLEVQICVSNSTEKFYLSYSTVIPHWKPRTYTVFTHMGGRILPPWRTCIHFDQLWIPENLCGYCKSEGRYESLSYNYFLPVMSFQSLISVWNRPSLFIFPWTSWEEINATERVVKHFPATKAHAQAHIYLFFLSWTELNALWAILPLSLWKWAYWHLSQNSKNELLYHGRYCYVIYELLLLKCRSPHPRDQAWEKT